MDIYILSWNTYHINNGSFGAQKSLLLWYQIQDNPEEDRLYQIGMSPIQQPT